MSFTGRWIFHSIGAMNEKDEMVYMSAEEYINSPMPYIDETDIDAVDGEIRERKQSTSTQLEVCEDGKLYMLLPLPEGISQEEVDAAVSEGYIKLYDGMMTDEPKAWEERNGELWLEVGLGMSEDGWVKLSQEDGSLLFVTTKFVKA